MVGELDRISQAGEGGKLGEILVGNGWEVLEDADEFGRGLGASPDGVSVGGVAFQDVSEFGVVDRRRGVLGERLEAAKGFFPGRGGFDDAGPFENVDQNCEKNDSSDDPWPPGVLLWAIGACLLAFFGGLLGEENVWVFEIGRAV